MRALLCSPPCSDVALDSSRRKQFLDACSPDPESDEPVGYTALAVHLLSLPWKLMFACIPPTVYFEGKITFAVALTFIGVVTALIGDVASLFGCSLGLPDEITAITFVALGTSLPDTFASRSAALADTTADAAIGNVTGSNAVNVFLGLGLPWMIGAFYWAVKGATPEWIAAYPDLALLYPNGGFVVRAGALSFSVSIFCFCAVVCIGTLSYRRYAIGAELGGPSASANATALLFLALWMLYISASSWKTLSEA